MDVKICLFVLCLAMAIGELNGQVSQKAGNCPLKSTVTRCTPSCMSDHQCPLNQKCCANKCGNNSCASPSAVNTGNNGANRGSSSGVLCEGRRCAVGEKCETDRSTKRNKCVRG